MPPIVPQGFFCRVFVRGHPVTCKWVTWRTALGSLLPLFHQRIFFSAATEQASTTAAFFGGGTATGCPRSLTEAEPVPRRFAGA